MARNDIPNGWDKIRQNVQETERLMGQKQYNQSMIKAKQTVEYMVKLQCEQAGIMEGSDRKSTRLNSSHSSQSRMPSSA